jgi:hypothetical protein
LTRDWDQPSQEPIYRSRHDEPGEIIYIVDVEGPNWNINPNSTGEANDINEYAAEIGGITVP